VLATQRPELAQRMRQLGAALAEWVASGGEVQAPV
jgi:hypothetical protein